jgi:hypothetical protein
MQQEQTHQPAPWRAVRGSDGYSYYNIMDAVGDEVCTFYHVTASDSPARLVSMQLTLAAPDLLAACKAVAAEWNKAPSEQDWTRLANLCADAVAKAEGGVR